MSGCRKEWMIHLASKIDKFFFIVLNNNAYRPYEHQTEFTIAHCCVYVCMFLLKIKIYFVQGNHKLLSVFCWYFFVSWSLLPVSPLWIMHSLLHLSIGNLVRFCLLVLTDFLLVGCGHQCYHYRRDKSHHILNMTGP